MDRQSCKDVSFLHAVLYRAETGFPNRLNGCSWLRPELYQEASGNRASSAQTALTVNNNIVSIFQQSAEAHSCAHP